MAQTKVHKSGRNVRNMTGNNANIDFVNINPYTKFREILLFYPQDIVQKRNFEQDSDINQGSKLYDKDKMPEK